MDNRCDPFHDGEQDLQERYGSRERLARNGPQIIRPSLTEQLQAFFQALPYVAFACTDETGLLRSTLLSGEAGFIRLVSANQIKFHVPEHSLPLHPGDHIAMLGIDFATRRRNRINGRIHQLDPDTLYIDVDQAFGNCPKYIQQRHLLYQSKETKTATATSVQHLQYFTADLTDRIQRADTCFIASRHSGAIVAPLSPSSAYGIDISHRGGHPGFIRVMDERRLCLPDYPGNQFFNTLGNIIIDPTASLLIVDFETGDLLQLSGTCHIDFGPAQEDWPVGAERLIEFSLDEALLQKHALPLRWQFGAYSPFLDFKNEVKKKNI